MELIFEPGIGADILPFGINRQDVRSQVLAGLPFDTPPGEPETDMFKSEGLILGYDDENQLEFVEVISPSSLVYAETDLLGNLEFVLASLLELGHRSSLEDGSYDFKSLRLILYCPKGYIESASIYKEGYYDDI